MIEIKGDKGKLVQITIQGVLYPNAENEWDQDFLKATVMTTVPGFTASFGFATRKTELLYFLEQVSFFKSFETKSIIFNTIEDNLFFEVSMDELGNVLWKIDLISPDNQRDRLTIYLETDFSSIDKMAIQLRADLV